MSTDNPFRQPLRRRNVDLKTVVRQADGRGKDAGGNTDFAIGRDYLWIAFDFSVPLAWITAVEPLGPGFVIAWSNPIAGTQESAAFCILRTGWGYNTKKRDELVRRVREAVSKAAAMPVQRSVAVAATLPSCEKCAEPHPDVYDFTWLTSYLMYMIAKPDRRLLCRRHGASRLRAVTSYNLTLGNLGIGLFASPVISCRNIRAGLRSGAIDRLEAGVWTILVFWPYALIVAALVDVARFVANF